MRIAPCRRRTSRGSASRSPSRSARPSSAIASGDASRRRSRTRAPDHARRDFDYVLIARRPALTSEFAALVGELAKAFARVHRAPAAGAVEPERGGRRQTGSAEGPMQGPGQSEKPPSRHRAVGGRAAVWQVFYAGPKLKEDQERRQRVQQEQSQVKEQPGDAEDGPGRCPRRSSAAGRRVPSAAPDGACRYARRRDRDAPRVRIETPSLRGSIRSTGGRIDDLVLVKYHETVDPKSPNVVLFSPSGAPHPYYAEYGWVGGPRRHPADARPRHGLARREGRAADAELAGDAGLGQRAGARLPAHDRGRCRLPVHRDGRGARTRPRGEITLHPFSLISRHGMPKTEGYYILHEGPIGVMGDAGLQELNYADLLKEGGTKTFKQTGGWLGMTDKYWAAGPDPRPEDRLRCQGQRHQGRQGVLPDRLPDGRRAHCRRAAKASSTSNLFAGAKQVTLIEAYQEKLQRQELRSADRLGLVLVHHQAAVQAAALAVPGARQLRPRHPRHHRAREGRVLPAGQQELRVDGQDEEAAAGDGEDPRALQGGSRQAAAGADGALQEREDQPDGGLPADRPADPGVLRALQGAVRHHRHAPGAVLRLDQGPVRARSDLAVQPVRPAAVSRCRTCCTSACGRSSWA